MVLAVAAIGLRPDAAAITPVDLYSATNFAVLAGSGITIAGLTTITGDIGTLPTPTITGTESPSFTLIGVNHGGDATTLAAKGDLLNSYNEATGRTPTTLLDPVFDLGTLTLTSGIYHDPTSLGITGILTLDGNHDPDSVWIFQAGTTLITEVNSQVVLINGASAANVFWQVGSSATLKTGSAFAGNILAYTSISLADGSSVDGRLLALNGLVSLASNQVNMPIAAVPEPGTLLLLLCSGLATLAVFSSRFFSRD